MQNGRSPTHLRPPGAANCSYIILFFQIIQHAVLDHSFRLHSSIRTCRYYICRRYGTVIPTEVAQQLPILVAQELATSWRYRSAVFSVTLFTKLKNLVHMLSNANPAKTAYRSIKSVITLLAEFAIVPFQHIGSYKKKSTACSSFKYHI